MKKVLLVITLLLTLLLSACNGGGEGSDGEASPAGVTMTATIKQMGEKIEVEVTKSEYASGIYWVITSNDTVFCNAKGETISRDALQVGNSVEISYSGQVMMSLPPQIVALKITVL